MIECYLELSVLFSLWKTIIKLFKMDCLRKAYQFITCISDAKFPTPYNFDFGSEENLKRNSALFESNFVRTSKYHWYDFLPKSLLLQFKRLANIYFLISSILMSIPEISPLSPLTAWGPFVFVLCISIVRQGYQDYQRYRSDRQLNHQSTTTVYRKGNFIKVQWSQIKIGQIVMVQSQELFPADLIILSTSLEGGIAFIETASLDGQKNLKPRNAFPSTQQYNNIKKLQNLSGKWTGTIPDKQLHNFSSTLTLSSGQKINYYKDKQLLYRGARLKNTKWIYGLVIYTGKNTKIMMNSQSSSQKMSQIQKKVNNILAVILILQFILCTILAFFNYNFLTSNKDNNSYINFSSYSIATDSFVIWCSYFVLLNTMIPISLIVSIEFVKLFQSYFINKDQLMYSQFRKKYSNVRSSSLNQQLGQIQYVFTDKTGTLTMNLMEFKIAVIGRKMFGDLGLILNDPLRPPQVEKGFQDNDLKDLISKGANNIALNDIFVRNKECSQIQAFRQIKELAEQYLAALAITHEVVAEEDKKGNKFYQGPSPDQITLVDAAKQMGFQFMKSTQTTTEILAKGEKKVFELLQVFPFNSDRKRMSVIVKSNGMIKMYIKGADSIIKSRLNKDNKLNLDSQLNKFAATGLRTLLIGMRIISNEEYQQFKTNVAGLNPVNKQQAYNQLVSDLQTNIYLIGATAVLDRLQDQVPQTIRDLIRASTSLNNVGIKVWMLTGDKMETAQNIAKSCNLIQPHFQILKYSCSDKNNILHTLQQLGRITNQLTQQSTSKALLIEGEDLTPIIGHQEYQKELANIAKYCEAVVCCRLLPIQKAQVVRIVRTRLNKITLAIGDGANDVPMIKTAHIGVGLFGEEGMGAVLASDYALPQFRMLWRLLLVHGRWNYIRISEMILYFFYKNMLFTVPLFVFAFYSGFSGQTIYDDFYISLYNLIFTSFPLVVRAVLEQDVYYIQSQKKQQSKSQEETSSQIVRVHNDYILQIPQKKYVPHDYQMNKYLYRLFPKIYFIGRENCIFNYSNFFLWTLEGAIEGTVISILSIYILSSESISESGYNSDIWLISLTIYSSVILVVTFKLSTHTKFWSVILFISIIILSLGLYVGYMWFSNYYLPTYQYVTYTTSMFYSIGLTYFIVLFSICFVLFIDGFVLSIDFQRGGYASKMRKLIEKEQEQNKTNYKNQSIRSSELNTINVLKPIDQTIQK